MNRTAETEMALNDGARPIGFGPVGASVCV
jgi:hypothetical protein